MTKLHPMHHLLVLVNLMFSEIKTRLKTLTSELLIWVQFSFILLHAVARYFHFFNGILGRVCKSSFMFRENPAIPCIKSADSLASPYMVTQDVSAPTHRVDRYIAGGGRPATCVETRGQIINRRNRKQLYWGPAISYM